MGKRLCQADILTRHPYGAYRTHKASGFPGGFLLYLPNPNIPLTIFGVETRYCQACKDPGPEGPALVHPGFRLVEPKGLQLGERGDMDDYLYQQSSGFRCRVSGSTTEFDPLCRSRS
jgi:hypothetical protein